jgi:hypothetical protein
LNTSVSAGTYFEDYCLPGYSDQLIERHCLSSDPYNFTIQYTCPNGCSNGACLIRIDNPNIALNKTTRQSSTYPANLAFGPDFTSVRAVDGSTSTFQHTYNSANEWWAIDLGKVYSLSEINMIKRVGFCFRPSFYIIQSADDFEFTKNVRNLTTKNNDSSCTVNIKDFGNVSISTRYLRVYDTSREYLNIAEFQVYSNQEIHLPNETICPVPSKNVYCNMSNLCYKEVTYDCQINATIATTNWKCIPCSDGCYNGACIGSNETPDFNVTIIDPADLCEGCMLDEKCYSMGYRKSGKFCSDNQAFTDYRGTGASCDNNFECSSNLCVDSECISGGLFKSMLNWFKRIFTRQ